MTEAQTSRRQQREGAQTLTPWLLLAGSVAFVVVALSSSVKTLIPPNLELVAESFSSSVGAVALGPTLFMVIYGLSSPVVGAAADRFGAHVVMVAGLAASGLGLVFAGISRGPVEFALAYGLLCGSGFAAVSYVPVTVFVQERVPARFRSTVFAVLSNGTAIGFIVFSPLWVHLSADGSWRPVFTTVGIVLAVPLAITAGLLLRPRESPGVATRMERESKPGVVCALRMLFRNRTYLIFTLSFASCGLSMGLVDVHVVRGLHDTGTHGATVGIAIAVLGVFELIVGVLAGRWVDRGWVHITSAASYLLRAGALLVLAAGLGNAGGIAFAVCFGASYMGTVIAATRAISDNVEPSIVGLGIGMMWMLHQGGSALVSQLGAYSIDHWGGLTPVITFTAVACIASGIVTAAPTITKADYVR